MRPIDADALEKEGWSLHRTIRVDMNTEEYQTKPLKQIPTIEPELYGYKIEHLALIARVMQKEGVTPEKAVQTFMDMKRIIEMLIDEIQEKVERARMEVEHETDNRKE